MPTDAPDPAGAGRSPVLFPLWCLGTAMAAICTAVLVLSFRFRYGEGYTERPLLLVLALFALATAGYLAALWLLIGRPVNSSPRAVLGTVVGFAVVFRLILLPSVPIQEIDFYRYLWDGRACASGFNPFRYSPAQVETSGPGADPRTHLGGLWQLAQASAPVRTIFERVHHREVPTVYPPASQAVFALAAAVTPADAPLTAHVLVLKALLLGFDLGTLVLVVALLKRLGLPPAWCVVYGWCPLALKEVANSGHLDSIAVFFTTLALYLLAVPRPARIATGRAALAAAVLGVAVLAKSYPVVLLPVVAAYLAARIGVRAVPAAVVLVGVVVAGYLPFLAPPGENTPWTGLGTFLGRWEMNDFLFMLTCENLSPPQGQPDHWFVLVPAAWREALSASPLVRLLPSAGKEPAFLLTQALMGTILLVLCLRWARRVCDRPEPTEMLRACFLTLAWGWLLSSAPNPWYLLWGLPLMVFDGRRSWWLLPGLALLYYLRFWLEYQALGSEEAMQAARRQFDFGLVWLEYLPFFLVLLAESLVRRR